MIERRRLLQAVALASLAVTISGCGIDRGGAPVDNSVAAIADSIDDAIIGPISNKGADEIVINDTTITVRDALIRFNGRSVDLTMLKPGYYAAVQGRFSGTGTAVASIVDVDFEAIGPVSNATPDAFDVLGQRVMLTNNTVLDDSLAGLDLTDPAQVAAVDVSGYADGAGNVQATHVALNTDGALRLTGFATDVMSNMLTLTLGDQMIDYSQATLIALFTAGPTVGGRMTVTFDVPGAPNELDATTLVGAPLLPGQLAEGGVVSLAGFVTGFIAPDDFAIAFVPGQLAAGVQVNNGAITDLAMGRLVRVTGTYTFDQRLTVTTLEFID